MIICKNRFNRWLAVSIITFSVSSAVANSLKTHVVEEKFDHTISDPYRWMENADDFKLKNWVEEQRNKTDQYLAGDLKEKILAELRSQKNAKQGITSVSQEIDTHYEQQLNQRIRKAPYVSNHDSIVNAVSSSGRYLATYSANNGGDFRTLQIFDTIENHYLRDLLHVKFANVYWSSNDEYLIYSTDRDHRNGGASTALLAHKIGESTNLKDKVIWEGRHEVQWASWLSVGKNDFLMVSDDKSKESALYALDLEGQTVGAKLWSSYDKISLIRSDDTYLYFISYQNHSNGEVIRLNTSTMTEEAFLPANDFPLERVTFWHGYIFASYLKADVTHKVMKFIPKTNEFKDIKLPFPGIYRFGGSFVYGGSYSVPWTYLTYNDTELAFEMTDHAKSAIEGSMFDAEPVFYTLPAGQESVVWVIKKKGTELNENTPLYLYGYGGFQINILPGYGIGDRYMPLLNRGGAVGMVTLPGGLEKGENWHMLGNLLNKINVFDAMASAARTLQEKNISSKNHMAIGGGSNGGLLVAATINLYPKLFKAAIPEVGVLDSLRYHKYTAGKWWVSEYGDPDYEPHFNYLKSYSPYHNIKEQSYPSILVMTGDGDDRVVPAHSYKYAAKLQDVLSNGGDDSESSVVLLHTAKFASHGGSRDPEENLEKFASKLTFLLKELK